MFRRLIGIIFAAVSVVGCASCSSGSYITHTETVFSSGMVFSVSLSGGKTKKTIEKMLAFLEEVDESVNINRSDSLLSQFNAAGEAQPIEVDAHAFRLAEAAKQLYTDTHGAFNAALGRVSALWGVDADGISRYVYSDRTTQPPSLPTTDQLSSEYGFTDINGLKTYTSGGKFYLEKEFAELTLDLGGLAKGYCADRLRAIAVDGGAESALIKISGNVMLVGDYLGGGTKKPWGVGVVNPRKKDTTAPEYVCGFYVSNASVVTSGDYERCFDFHYDATSSHPIDPVKVCHIIDSRSLMPIGVTWDDEQNRYRSAASYVMSATVIGPDSMYADAYSTAVCVMGAKDGAEFLASKGYSGIIFTSDYRYISVGDVNFAEGYTQYLTEYSPLA